MADTIKSMMSPQTLDHIPSLALLAPRGVPTLAHLSTKVFLDYLFIYGSEQLEMLNSDVMDALEAFLIKETPAMALAKLDLLKALQSGAIPPVPLEEIKQSSLSKGKEKDDGDDDSSGSSSGTRASKRGARNAAKSKSKRMWPFSR